MRYGFCTGFASTPLWAIQGSMLARIRDAGFDYAELPAMSFADMDPCGFSSVLGAFDTPVACNLFPGRIPLVSWERDLCVICDYLDVVLSRAVSLGIGKIVFGSGASRSYDPIRLHSPRFNGSRRMVTPYSLAFGTTTDETSSLKRSIASSNDIHEGS